MNITFKVPNELKSQLERQAERAGRSITGFVLEVVCDKLRDLEADGSRASELSHADWSARLQAWADSFPAVSRAVDDSRESIYEDRS